jgi:hypothetical protein
MKNDNIIFFPLRKNSAQRAENELLQIHKQFTQTFRIMLKVYFYGKFEFSINNLKLNHLTLFIFHQCHMGSLITHTLYEQFKRRFFGINIYKGNYAKTL